jgi:phosphinothricin acetyltransferase
MKIINCSTEYSQQILDIFNEAILNSTALYDYSPRPIESMVNWFNIKKTKNFPVIGLIDDQGRLLGFGSYGTFRAWPAYKYSIEHSLYIQKDHRGQGLGKILLSELIKIAQDQNYHCLIGGIDSSNESSVKLHKQAGFEFCGRIKQAGFKFSKWLDLDFYQLILSTPSKPIDG